MPTYFSSEFRFVEFCLESTRQNIARYEDTLATAKLTRRQRAKIEAWLWYERSWLAQNEAKRDMMLAENFDIVRRTLQSEYEIVALDPARPILCEGVTLVRREWSAYRTETNTRAHGIRGWYDVGAREQVLTPKEAN